MKPHHSSGLHQRHLVVGKCPFCANKFLISKALTKQEGPNIFWDALFWHVFFFKGEMHKKAYEHIWLPFFQFSTILMKLSANASFYKAV